MCPPWTRLIGAAALLALASCSTGSNPTAPATCVEPPADEINRPSDLVLLIEPTPAVAGSRVVLSIEPDGLPTDAVVGAGVEWQCWNGVQWVATHQVVRGFEGYEPVTNEAPPGATTAVVAIGLSVPNAYDIIIPVVASGTYRISDGAIVSGDEISGFVIVVVE